MGIRKYNIINNTGRIVHRGHSALGPIIYLLCLTNVVIGVTLWFSDEPDLKPYGFTAMALAITLAISTIARLLMPSKTDSRSAHTEYVQDISLNFNSDGSYLNIGDEDDSPLTSPLYYAHHQDHSESPPPPHEA